MQNGSKARRSDVLEQSSHAASGQRGRSSRRPVAIVWNGSCEAARAVALAMPMLEHVETVTVLAGTSDMLMLVRSGMAVTCGTKLTIVQVSGSNRLKWRVNAKPQTRLMNNRRRR